jgi:basic membrane protein A
VSFHPTFRRAAVLATALLSTSLAACGGSSGSGSSATAAKAGSGTSVCLMTSATGVADRSFNQQAWAALQKAKTDLGIDPKYLSQSGSTDYPTIGQQFVSEGCNMIVGVGYNTTKTVESLAKANPDIKFAVIDDTLDGTYPNATSMVYETNQASYLGGYLAAGMSTTGTVGVYGNQPIPPVELYMTGYVQGVEHYNQVHGKSVKVIGWDPAKKTGQFAGSFTDVSKGKLITESELQQGADIIFAVAGPIDQGTAVAVKNAGGPDKGKYMLWVDSDGCISSPEYCGVILSTVEKKIDTSLYDLVSKTVKGSFPTGTYTGTSQNGGVGLAPYHDLTAKVPAALQAEITALQADIAAGKVTLAGQ